MWGTGGSLGAEAVDSGGEEMNSMLHCSLVIDTVSVIDIRASLLILKMEIMVLKQKFLINMALDVSQNLHFSL